MNKLMAAAAAFTVAAAPAYAANTTFAFGGATQSATSINYSSGGLSATATGYTYTVAPVALTSFAQLTPGGTVRREQGGIGIFSSGEDNSQNSQVDTNGTNEALLLSFNGATARLVSGLFNFVDENDTLRIYGVNGTNLTLLGFPGEFYDNTAGDSPMSGGATATGPSGQLNSNSVFTVNFAQNLGDYQGYLFTVNTDGPDGYRLQSLTVAAVPETATWAMMLVGFGGLGAALRRRRAAAFA